MPAFKRVSFAAVLLLLLLAGSSFAYEVDDTLPEVTDRVARISFIRGEVKIRRSGSDDWEKADLNLPVVEGDEISTGDDSRLEIQFNTRTHLRAGERAFLQIKGLSDDGIAVSVSTGTVTATLRKFDKDKEFFEIDAPQTTVAAQREGYYRVDAGDANSGEVRVTINGGGEARVYSLNSGFSLKSGRSAKVFTGGDYAGEWETSDASRFADEFDAWVADRSDMIAKRVASANYDTYYDQDIYGAEDLNDNGSWEYTRDYGYVWRPYDSAINIYRDWSPYRYGSWRWVPPFGWTWVNDEPWGWATYHHGRWIWYHGRWVWTPYGYYRSNRSWWYPALVVVQVINTNICWYPLPYRRHYYNYNSGYHDWVGNRDWRRSRNDNRSPGASGNPPPVQVTGGGAPREIQPYEAVDPDQKGRRRQADPAPTEGVVPPTGVVMIPKDTFGVRRRVGSTAPPDIGKSVLARSGKDDTQLSELPDYQSVRTRPGRDFSAQPPAMTDRFAAIKRTGAAERRPDTSLDKELLRTRILGDRPPAPINRDDPVQPGGQDIPRRTGAVGRPPSPKRDVIQPSTEPNGDAPVPAAPPRRDMPRPRQDNSTDERRQPRREPSPRVEESTPRFEPQPRSEPLPKQEENPRPRVEPPQRRENPSPRVENPAPRNDPPRRESPPPRQENPSPRNDAPRREPPAPRQETPRNEPKPERKPDAPTPRIVDRKKDTI